MTGRNSTIRGDTIEYAFQLVFDEQGHVRVTRSEGKLDRGERAMGMLLKVPRSLWRTPQLRASIEIADPGLPKAVIDVKAASDALREVTGLDIDIRVVEPTE